MPTFQREITTADMCRAAGKAITNSPTLRLTSGQRKHLVWMAEEAVRRRRRSRWKRWLRAR